MLKVILQRLLLLVFLITPFLFANQVQAQFWKKGNKPSTDESEFGVEAKAVEAEKYFIEGVKYFILEDYNKAKGLFEKSLDYDPENDAVHYKIAETLFNSGELEKALFHAKKAVELDGQNKFYYLKLSEIYAKLGNYKDASAVMETLVQNVPGTNEYLFELAAFYLFQKEYKNALSTYEKIENEFGLNEQVVRQKQRIYLETNDLDLAIAEGEKLIDANPGEPEFWVDLAEIMISNGREEAAIEKLNSYLTEIGEDGKIRLSLAKAYQKRGASDKAQENYTIAFSDPTIDINEKFQVIAQNFAQINEPGVKANTEKMIKQMMDAHPGNGRVRAMYGDLLYQARDLKGARGQYVEAIDMGENNFEIWRNVIMIDLEQNEVKEAIEHSDEALELYPNQAFLYYLNGTANLMQKNHEDAVFALEQGLKLSSKNEELQEILYGQLGDAYNGIKEYSKSDQAYESALELNPENDHVLNNYSYFLSLRKEKLDQAKKMSAQLVKNNPSSSTYLDTYAWVLYQMGEYDQALKYIEMAVKEEASGTIIEHYGDILYKLGDIEKAVKQWQKAKGMDETSDLIDKKIADRKLYE